MGGVVFPLVSHPASDGRVKSCLIGIVSVENPYSIRGLYSSSASVTAIRSFWSIRSYWHRLAAGGYSQDRIAFSAGFAFPQTFLRFAVETEVETTDVSGCGSTAAAETRYSAILDISPHACLQASAGGEGSMLSLRAGERGLDIVLNVAADGDGRLTYRAGGHVKLSERLALMTGCRFDTGEVSGGISLGGAFPAALSWSEHPVLGSTYSFSFGAVR
jgi:hypothetical protein